MLAEAGRRLFAKAAKVQLVSRVVAGDSFVAVYVLATARGQDSAGALADGAAAASAAVTTDATQLCHLADVERLLPECAVSAI